MVQRYRNQINEAATPAAFGRNYVDGAATGVSVAGAIAGAGDELRRFAEVRKRQQDEWDAATVMNAQTEYARQMAEWMDNPETGKLQILKLGAARGLTDETFRYADELAKKNSRRSGEREPEGRVPADRRAREAPVLEAGQRVRGAADEGLQGPGVSSVHGGGGDGRTALA